MAIEGFFATHSLKTRSIYVARTTLAPDQKIIEEIIIKKPKLYFKDFDIKHTDTLIAFFWEKEDTEKYFVKKDITQVARLCGIDLALVSDIIDVEYAKKLEEDEKKKKSVVPYVKV